MSTRTRGGHALVQATVALPWAGFVIVHVALIGLCLFAPGHALGDVDRVYRNWAEAAASGEGYVGISMPFVYPLLAFVPMILALAAGPGWYPLAWLIIVTMANAAAFALLVGRCRAQRRTRTAWWWLGFLVLLGPIALARIDAITVPLVVIALLWLARRPVVATALLTVAAWVKVWPAVVIAALVVAYRQRSRVLAAAVGTSVVIVVVALLLGSGWNVFSFVTQQTGRGIQIEAPVALLWLWPAAFGVPGNTIYYDHAILTFQVAGAGTGAAGALMTPLLVIAVAVILAIAWRSQRRHAPFEELFPPLVLGMTVALIAFNKVGSPQFISWLAVPGMLGLVLLGRRWRTPAVLILALAALTQVIYPYLYDWLLVADPLMVFVLTVRNLLEFAVLGVAVRRIWTAGRSRSKLGMSAANASPVSMQE